MPHHPFHYTLYGLTLACNAPLAAPGLCRNPAGAATESADVLIDWAGVAADEERATAANESPAAGGAHLFVEATGGWLAVSRFAQLESDWTRLRFGYADHHVQFDIAPGAARIVITWTRAVLPAHVITLLFSTVMNYLLYAHGRLALHASVVAWRDVAFIFAGAQGAGKSTTVTALIRRGCRVVSDDVAALARRPDGWAIFPGQTGVRLTPQAQAALGVPVNATTPLWPRLPQIAEADYQQLNDKAVVSFGDTPDLCSGSAPLPLAGIFLLPPRARMSAALSITTLPAAAAVPRLAGHLLTPAWLKQTVDQKRLITLADLARHTPVRVAERPDTLAALPQLCDALLDEMERLRL